jgi:lysophospholipase L1-like esterase
MATSTFFTSFKTGPGAKLEGYSGHIYLVPSGSAVNGDMPLTEDTGRPGQYFRENVPDGEYKVYVDLDKSGSPVEGNLYKIPGSGNPYLVWHGEKTISDVMAGTATPTTKGLMSAADKAYQEKLAAMHDSTGKLKLSGAAFVKPGKNLFNKDTVTSDKYVNYENGELWDSGNYVSSDFIQVEPSTGYVRSQAAQMAFYDENREYISGQNEPAGFTTPSNCMFVRLSVYKAWLDSYQVEKGSASTAYEPFYGSIKELKVASENIQSDVKLNMYPYHPGAPRNLIDGLSAIIDLGLFNADSGKKYCVSQFWRNYTGIWRLQIYELSPDGSSYVRAVAEFYKTGYTEPSGVEKIVLAESGNSGIYGYAIVDWSLISAGTHLSGMYYADSGLDKNTYLDKSPVSKSPFQMNANLPAEIREAIKSIAIYGADKSKKYSLAILARGYNSTPTWRISIYEVDTENLLKVVCYFYQPNYVEPDGIDTVILSDYTGSGVSGKVLIDWTKITSGASFFSMGYNDTGFDETVINEENYAEIILPDSIPAIIGNEMNIYYENVILANDLRSYQIDVVCAIGKQQEERWTCIPTGAGTYPLTINIYRNYTDLVASASTNILVKGSSAGTGINRKCLFIGDSTTAHGYYQHTALANFAADPMDITTIGTINEMMEDNNNYEGRSGWSIDMYYTRSDSPFVYNGEINFYHYMTANGYSGLEYVLMHLGINDTINYKTDEEFYAGTETTFYRLQSFFNSIRAYDANIKIVIMLTIPPFASQDGYGKVFGSGQTRWRHRRNNHLWNKYLIQTYGGRTSEKYYIMPFNVNLDLVHNAQTETIQVNSRNSMTVIRQSDGQHPAPEGYAQMGDTVYYWLKCQES